MMKNKLVIGLLTLAVAGTATYNITSNAVEKVYSPRNEQAKNAQGWKGAAEYYHKIRANAQTGRVDIEDIQKASKEVKLKSAKGSRASLGLSWQPVGPDNVGGRTRGMIIYNQDETRQTLFAGAVAGGLYKSTDGAAYWTRLEGFDRVADSLGFFSPAISTIAQGPNGEIYVGTGAEFEGAFGYKGTGMIGRGVYKSVDGGDTWIQLENASPSYGNNSSGSNWVYVNRLAVDQNSGHIYAAGNMGMQKSTDGGETWELVIGADPSCSNLIQTDAKDVKVTPSGAVVCVVGSKIYQSDNGEPCTFEAVSGINSGVGRISIAYSEADEDYFYAIAVKSGELENIYKSTDGGKNWSVLQGPIANYFDENSGLFNGQGNYDLAIGANPFNKEDVIVGGVQLWRHDGSLKRIAAEFGGGGGFFQYVVHSDKHDVVFDEKTPNVVYILSDGGVAKSIDGGVTWFDASKGYLSFQAYNVGYDSDGKVMGGSQDNGTVEVTGDQQTPMYGVDILGGDGFGCDYSQITDIRFASLYYERINRGIDGAGTMGQICTEAGPGPICNDAGVFDTKLRIWESLNDPYSQSVVEFENINERVGVKKGDGTTRKFKTDFDHPKSGGQFVKGGFKMYVGTENTTSYQEATDSAITDTEGVLIGAGGTTGTVNYATGEVEVVFGKAPTETQTIWGEFKTLYPVGTTIELQSNTSTSNTTIDLSYTLPANLNPGESVFVKDPVQSLLAVNTSNGLAITRQGLDLSEIPSYIVVPGAPVPNDLEFSRDGNYLFVAGNSALYRVSGLQTVYSQSDISSSNVDAILSGKGVITGVGVDPNNADNVIVTIGGYGGTNYVWSSSNATSSSPTFTNVTGDLPKMPCYDVILDVNDGNKAILATEYGIWATDDIYGSSVTWTDESGELGNVPVFEIRQQFHDWEISQNKGEIYLGTHSRGLWKSGTLTSTADFNEFVANSDKLINSLNVFPNPMNDQGYVAFNLANEGGSGTINIFDINGKLVSSISENFNPGDNTVNIDVSNLEMGNYLVSLEVNGEKKISKFVVM